MDRGGAGADELTFDDPFIAAGRRERVGSDRSHPNEDVGPSRAPAYSWDAGAASTPPMPPASPQPARQARAFRCGRMTGWNWLVILVTAAVAFGVTIARSSDAVPLGTPPPAPAGEGGYSFLAVQDDGSGRPVAWDPCSPIPFVIRRAGEPPGGEAMVRWAMAEITRVTGLQFADRGYTDEAPTVSRPLVVEARYGGDPAPVLIAWSTPQEFPGLDGDVVGMAGPRRVSNSTPGTSRYVSGALVLDAPDLAGPRVVHTGLDVSRHAILHELGHLVGLGHVPTPGQVMYGETSPVAGFGEGDLRGLHALGSGRCF